ncbi:TAXI family TRAP transporter solute-binding subunit [Polynucleobacter necessarius]|uniref:TAXI family TRAP transporter solute-binding subunit n=1 Tax=Polynucleobacter necessarius TaxID=576610 RepID=UPI0018D557B8|nr:TAXI family TRAP transporter solute-binding subunit [Polynucleobacter necessarius]
MGIWWYADPPPRHVILATGLSGGSYEALGKKYADFFAKKGVTLELMPTNGAQENLSRLSDRNDPVQAAFVQAGVAHPKTTTGIQSLGAIGYDPTWFFYRGAEVNRADFEVIQGHSKYFANRKISVGVEGSGTHAQAMRILKVSGLDRTNLQLLELPGDQAVKALKGGEIDAAFIVDAFEAPNIQALLTDPTLHLITFRRAEAFAKLIPYLQILKVPEGSFSLEQNFPNEDIKLVATTTNLLIDDRMHPAIQFLFLEAAREINGRESFFTKKGELPSFKDSLLPESPVAIHYEKNRYPLITSYFPFWLAELINRLIFILLPFLVVAYPALQVLPSFRTRRMYNKINRLYGELKAFEQELLTNFDQSKQDEYLKRLDLFEYQALNINVSKRLASDYYALRTSIDYVRSCLNRGALLSVRRWG